MKSIVLSIAALAASIACAGAADIAVSHPWARATPAGASVGAGYLTLQNSGAADKLVSVASDVAARVEIHEMSMDAGVMKMRALPGGLDIPAGKSVELKPGGYHLMLMGLKQPLKAGDTIKAIVTFAKGGAMPIEMKVEAIGASGQSH